MIGISQEGIPMIIVISSRIRRQLLCTLELPADKDRAEHQQPDPALLKPTERFK